MEGKNLHTIGYKNGPEGFGEHGDSQRSSLDDTGLGSLEQFADCGHLLQDFEKLQKTELVNILIFRKYCRMGVDNLQACCS